MANPDISAPGLIDMLRAAGIPATFDPDPLNWPTLSPDAAALILAWSDARRDAAVKEKDTKIRDLQRALVQEAYQAFKGNIDAELVLWAMKDINEYDKAIVVSGDGDFYCLVEYLDEKQKLLKLLAPTRKYSSLYNKFEHYVVRLDNYRRDLEYRDRRRKMFRKK